jgi:hypothetical protein
MAQIQRRLYRDWDEFVTCLRPELFGDGPFESDRYLFRGVADADWRLKSSFDRIFGGASDPQRLSEHLLEEFRAGCTDLVEPTVLADADLALALGQHHGLPTRLLDWTVSPYVAAFFALSGTVVRANGGRGYASIWALHLDAPIWNAPDGVAIVKGPATANPRLRNQGGRFTRSLGSFASVDEYVAHADYTGTALTQLSVPTADAERALAQLEMMSITAARLFPDVDGAARAALINARLMPTTHRNGAALVA